MDLQYPNYYSQFHCIAGCCPDSCCKDWAVQVDLSSAAYYRALPGPTGDLLRTALTEEDGEAILSLTADGRCPMWQADGLCRLQAEYGEAALCQVCRDFPRLRHDYGSFVQLGLELSCPEAARIILSHPDPQWVTEAIPGGESPEYDENDMLTIRHGYELICGLLRESSLPFPQRLALSLLQAETVQENLDGLDSLELLDTEKALEDLFRQEHRGNIHEILRFYKGLEILTPQWLQLLNDPSPAPWDEQNARALARYFADRYLLQSISDYDFLGRVQFLVVSCLVIFALGGDLLRTAQLYGKEIENCAENMDALLEAIYSNPAFQMDNILGLLLKGGENV